MKYKKIIIITLTLVLIYSIFAIYYIFETGPRKNGDFLENVKTSLFCAKEGEPIGASGMPESCCQGLKPIGGMPDGYDGDCSLPQPPTGLSICANCGDGVCNSNYEGKCNCPADCAKSKCGKEGEGPGGDIDRCCQGLRPKSSSDGDFGGIFECVK